MGASLLDTITPVDASGIKNTDRVYIAKVGDEDNINFVCDMLDFLTYLVKHVYALDENYQ